VTLYLSVLDKQGKPVSDLGKQDFQVFEENQLQTIKSVQFERDTPVSVGVLIDISRSMGGEGINEALSWLKLFAERLKSPDELFVNAFSDESQELVDYVSPEDYLQEPVDHLGVGGQARMGLALDLALIKLREAHNKKRALLFLSAGRDAAGPATLDHISRFGHPIYALGIPGSSGASGTLDKLKNLNLRGSALKVYADHSGGDARFVTTGAEANEALEDFCRQLKSQYRLEYTSDSRAKPGKMMKVEVKVNDTGLELRHLKKYPITSH
jgi:VWFA-related protein